MDLRNCSEARRGKSRRRLLSVCLALACACIGCGPSLRALEDAPRAAAETTTGPWSSLIYAARTDSGVIVIDLGWLGAEPRLGKALSRVGATPEEVKAVFLTHSHRDHIYGWPLLRLSRFYLGEREIDRFTGTARHAGWAARSADDMNPVTLPRPGELAITGISQDTAFVFGRDTLWAFPVPGHTAGSTAYLFRGTLFVGDAIGWAPLLGFGPAKPRYTDDLALSKRSVDDLWKRLEGRNALRICTAHGRCAPLTDELKAEVR